MLKVDTFAAAAPAPSCASEEVARSIPVAPNNERRERHGCLVPAANILAPQPKPRRGLAQFLKRWRRNGCLATHAVSVARFVG
jgi:hypothetical protein